MSFWSKSKRFNRQANIEHLQILKYFYQMIDINKIHKIFIDL